MRLTSKNQKELRLIRYYIPDFMLDIDIDDESIKTYFDWSDRGIGKKEVEERIADENRTKKFTGLSALYFGKRYRDLAVTSYLEDWGDTCTSSDFVDEPKEVAEFLSKAMNKPGIIALWKVFNDPSELTDQDEKLLEPLSFLAERGMKDGEKS